MLGGMGQDRKQLITRARTAETPTQIKAAKVALKSWQARHPDDPEVHTARSIISEGGLAKGKARMGLGAPRA